MDGARPAPEPDREPGRDSARDSPPQGDAPAAGRRLILRDDRDQVEAAVVELLDAMTALGYDDASGFAVRLSLEEAINNGFRHGNKSDPSKVVRLTWSAWPERIHLEIQDEGEGFDPGAVPDPTAEENLEIPSGRGLMLMRAYMSEVEYLDPGNKVRMVYVRGAGGG